MNKVFVKKKQIVIDHKGDIPVLGVSGPIDTPYWETLDRISQMLMYNVRMYEVLSNGEKVQLDLCNFDQENDENATGIRAEYVSTAKTNPTKLDTTTEIQLSTLASEANKALVVPKTQKVERLTDAEEKVNTDPRHTQSATIRTDVDNKASRKAQKASKLYVPPKTDDVEEI